MNQVEKAIKIIGVSTVTSNEAAFSQNTIGKLWDQFLKSFIKDKLTDIASSSVFAVYSDYEDGYQGQYKIIIGYAVDDINEIPNGLTTVTISAGKYKAFKSKSQSPIDIVNTWQSIWKIDPNVFQSNFITNFEEYKDNGELIIYMGHD